MGWDTNLDPEKLPKAQDLRLPAPVLSMDDYARFCARMRLEGLRHSLHRVNSLEENLPVNVLFRI